MGISDRFKELRTKAEAAAAEHSDQIHAAVEKVATTADERTKGKYTEKIQQAGSKATGIVDGLKADGAAEADAEPAGDSPS